MTPGLIIIPCPVCGQRLRLPSGLGQVRATCPSCRHQWTRGGGGTGPDQQEVPDYYETLQVSARADAEVIEAAYRRLAQRHHPDRNPGDERAVKQMVLLNRAREVLLDPILRAEYDTRRTSVGNTRESAECTTPPPPSMGRPQPARAAKSDSQSGGHVQLSARIIHWPQMCACCCGRPNTTVEISHTRTTGVKVIREQTKGWQVPYCRKCLDHIDTADELDKTGGSAINWSFIIVVLFILTSIFVFSRIIYLPALAFAVLAVVWLAIMAVSLWASLTWSARDVQSSCSPAGAGAR